MREKSTGTVRFRVDPENLPRLSGREAAALRAREVDTRDIPSQRGVSWTRPGALIAAENKQQVTLRLDRDVLEFFKETGKRYQSRINAVLRQYVEANRKTG